MGNYYNYMRISTDDKKQSFGRQEKALAKYAKDNKVEYLVEFREEKSAKNFEDRKVFQKLDRLVCNGDTVVFKDLSRFTREADNGYLKYMEWFSKGVNMVFIDNPVICSNYIKDMLKIAEQQDIVTRTALEGTIKLLLIVELDRAEKQRLYISKAITDGIKASNKKSGRPVGKLDKMTDGLRDDILLLLRDRNIKYCDIMRKYNISRNTLKKYVTVVGGNADMV